MLNLRQKYKFVKDRIKKDKFDVDEEGREIVDLTITDSDSLLSVYNPDGKPIIDENMANVISNSIKSTTFKKDIHLKISCEKYTKDKEPIYKDAITNYYINEFADKERRLHNNLAITITTFLLAIISFVALFVFTQLDFHWLLLDFIDVIAWVFSWETVDLIFFQRQLIKFEQRQDLKIIFAKITLSNLTKTRKTK